MHDSKQATPLLQDCSDNKGLDSGVSAKERESQPSGDDDKDQLKISDTIISQHHLLRHGVKSRFLRQESDRFIAFTDAVVAVAITLLILPLSDGASAVGSEESEITTAHEFFSVNGDKLGAFFLSFWMIMRLWNVHHSMFGYVGNVTRRLMTLNFCWLAGIVFFPVTMSLVKETSDKTGVGVYYGILLIIAFFNLLMCLAIRIDDNTWRGDRAPGLLWLARNVVGNVLHVVALVLALLKPEVDTWATLLILGIIPVMFIVQKVKPDWEY